MPPFGLPDLSRLDSALAYGDEGLFRLLLVLRLRGMANHARGAARAVAAAAAQQEMEELESFLVARRWVTT